MPGGAKATLTTNGGGGAVGHAAGSRANQRLMCRGADTARRGVLQPGIAVVGGRIAAIDPVQPFQGPA